MQDFIDSRNLERGKIRPGERPVDFTMRYSKIYLNHSSQSTTIEEVTLTPLAKSLQFELELLLSESEDVPIENDDSLMPEKVFILTKEKGLIRFKSIIRKELTSTIAKSIFSKKTILTAVAILLISTTLYVTFDTWATNNSVKAESSRFIDTKNTSNSDINTSNVNYATATQEKEGTDETKPTVNLLKNYIVSPTLPRALYIKKLHIAARILPMGINDDGSIKAPINIHDSGWYNGSVKPGEIGAMFIDGHASGASRLGLFAYLDKLNVGDELQIEKGDNTLLNYRVVHTEIINLKDVDMKKLLLPYGNTLKGLNLMTCTGKWLNNDKTYDKRVVVWTEQI